MALSLIQAGAAVGTVASGSAGQVLGGPCGIGTCVVLAISLEYSGATVSSITSGMGTFTKVASYAGPVGYDIEWWVCLNTTADHDTVTVTSSTSLAPWEAAAFEFEGGVASAASGGTADVAPGTSLSLTTSLAVGDAVLVAEQAAVNISGAPAAPWADFSPGGFFTTAWQIAAGTSVTATWAFTTSQDAQCLGIILTADTPTPQAPTLISPANASIFDSGPGVTPEGTYNTTGADAMSTYAMRLKTSGGAYSYWNAGTNAFQSEVLWNSDSVIAGGTVTVSIPAAAIPDGATYNWSIACQDAVSGGQGPFAVDYTFTAQVAPSVTVTAPSGTVGVTTQPTVQWTATTAPSAVQVTYSIIVESGTYGTTPGSGTTVWTSGSVTSGAGSAQVGTPLLTGTSYRAFVQITQTGGQNSAWAYTTFTITVDTPMEPLITATVATDTASVASLSIPIIELTVQGLDNYLSAADSSFEGGSIGTAVGTNCTPTSVGSQSLDGNRSLKITPTASGNASVRLGPYAASVGQEFNAFAAFKSGANARTCTVGLQWIGGSGTVTSTGTADSTSAWTQATPTSAPAAGLLVTGTAPTGTTGVYIILTVDSTTGSSDTHFVDCVALKTTVAGTTGDTTWSLGGFVGLTSVVITRSDNKFVRWASLNNPLPIPSTGGQVATVYDYEAVPGVAYTYEVYAQVASIPLQSAPNTSASVTQVTTAGWWELNPLMGSATSNPSAVNAQMINWAPVQTEQSQANPVLNQTTMNIVANAMMAQDFTGTAETFSDAIYTAFNALLVSQATLFISSPWGSLDSGYFRVGPQSGGMSSGVGNTAKTTTLMPSVAGAGHRSTAVTTVAQQRPGV